VIDFDFFILEFCKKNFFPMKKSLISLIISLLWLNSFAQNTKVMDSPSGTVISNAGGTDIPYSSSILDIRSNTKAVLLPRMTTTNRNAITSPIAGMLLYNSTSNQFNYHDGTAWQQATFGNQWNVAGTNYYYNGGNVGIGDATPDYKLDVAGTTYTSDLIVNNSLSTYSMNSTYGDISYKLSLNNPTQSSLLALKGDESSFGSWGQHIILENATNTNYGGILHDADGMKFRNFGANDNFYFRNSVNNTIASIDPSGNTQIDGTLTVNNNKGVAYNASNSNNLRIYRFTTAVFNTGNMPAHGSATTAIAFNGGFTSTPTVLVGDIESTGGTTGELDRVILVLRGCSYSSTTGETSCIAKIINTDNSPVNYSIYWNIVAIGY
jgi:hypothetical protein